MGLDEAELAGLRARVSAFRLDDPGDAVPFSRKLRRGTGWSATYAARAIEEYKRFVILAVAAGRKVSPSKAVDRVWHLHLTDTRRYWDDFCPNVLGRPLHHEPSRGGPEEAEALASQYRATLIAYERLFGEAPPRDIWPSGPAIFRRLRRGLAFAGFGPGVSLAAAATLPLALVGCAVVDSASPGAIQGPQFILGYVALCVVSLVIMGWLQGLALTPRPAPTVRHENLGSYELAYLAGGTERVFATALLRLTESGNLVIAAEARPRRASRKASQQALSVGAPLPAKASPVDQAIVTAVRLRRLTGPVVAAAPLGEMQRRLRSAGLLPSFEARRTAAQIGAAVILLVMILGVARLWFGIANHRAVGFLIITLMFTPILAVVVTAIRLNGPTPYARRLVRAARADRPLVKDSSDPDPALAFALWGLAAVAAADFSDYRRVALGYGVGATGGDGSSSSCGGGSCGGGGCGG